MKRNLIIALISLILVMAVSVVAVNNSNVSAFADNNKLQEEKSNLEVISEDDFRVKELRENGILIGDEKGNLQLGETLKRQEMVVLISRLMGKESEAKKWDTSKLTFEDVEKENWAAGYIAWAKDNNITKGYSEEQFGYNDSLTKVQTEIFLLRVLGNEAEIDNAEVTSYRIGLIDNVKNPDENYIIRGDVAIILYNALYISDEKENTLANKLEIKSDLTQEEKELRINLDYYNVEYLNKEELNKEWVCIYINAEKSNLSNKEEEEYKDFIHSIISAIGYKNMKIVDISSKLEIIAYCNIEKRQVLALEVDGIYNYFNMKQSF